MKTADEWLAECPEELDGDIMQQIVGQERFRKVFPADFIQRIQSDARADLEQRVKELEKDKARLDWLASINNADRLYSLDGGFMITDDYGAGEVYSTIRQAIDAAMKEE